VASTPPQLGGSAYLRFVGLGALIGIPAGMAAATRLLITPALFASLLVGTAGSMRCPRRVLAAAAAWLTITALDRRAPGAPALEGPQPSTA